MKYGVPFRIKRIEQVLEIGGYRVVPTHAYSHMVVYREFITEGFPRFHAIQDMRKKWWIHYDYFVGEEHRTSLKHNKIRDELKRLEDISAKIKYERKQTG